MLQIVWGHNGSGAFGTSQHPRGVRVQLVPAIHTCYFQKISYSEIWLFAPSVCLVSLLTRYKKAQQKVTHCETTVGSPRGEPVALTLAPL